jgi:hypothetical protein
MSIGITVGKSEIDSRMGQLARDYQKVFRDLAILKSYFDATADPTLVALGYTAGEVAILKSAIADLNQLYDISRGAVNLAVIKDFNAFVRQLWGVGAQ